VSSRAYRVAPRRRTAARPASRIDWERVGRISLVLVLFAILVLYVNPVVNFVDAWRDSRAESTVLQELKEENRALRERAATLASPDAAERGAREQGMVSPDERSVVICPPEGCHVDK
jgi:cell division protein FtsB